MAKDTGLLERLPSVDLKIYKDPLGIGSDISYDTVIRSLRSGVLRCLIKKV